MCQQVVILAERNNRQYVSQCEHGTVHLVWDGVGLHLPAEAFNRLSTQIFRTRSILWQRGESTNQGHCRLSIGKLSITLPVEEFLLLVEMVEAAMPGMSMTDHGKNDPWRKLPPYSPSPPAVN